VLAPTSGRGSRAFALSATMQKPAIERFVGLDIGNKIALCELQGERIKRVEFDDDEMNFEKFLGPHSAPARVVFEACRQGWYLYDLLTGWGHEVWIVDTTRVKQIGIGHHKRKNDRIDAGLLARAAAQGRVPKAHVLSREAQQIRMKLQVRATLVQTRAAYVTQIRGLVRTEGLMIPSCHVDNFLSKVDKIELPASVHELIRPLIDVLRTIDPQIIDVDKQLDALLEPVASVQILSSAPGVANIVAAAFISVIDSPNRFRTAHQVQAYLGLVPSERTSGRRKLGAITKQGNAYVRALLVQAAWCVLRQKHSDPLKHWGMAVAKKRGKRVAAVAVARRLAGILWAMWRTQTHYDRELLGSASARGKHNESADAKALAKRLADKPRTGAA
jgi:transposase